MDSELLIAKYERLINQIATKYHQRNVDNGIYLDDLVQEGRIAVWKACGYPAFKALSDEGAMKRYLTRAIVLALRDYIINDRSPGHRTTIARRDSQSFEWVNNRDLPILDDSSIIDTAHEDAGSIDVGMFMDHVAEADKECGDTLRLLYDGHPYRNVSEELGISVARVRKNLFKIRRIYDEYISGRYQAA